MLGGLWEWARRAGLVRGQRNRGTERALSNLRNFVAHPTSYHLITPADAANTIADLAEIINHLWGSATPGGRLYPAPTPRTTIALMWSKEGSEVRSVVMAGLPADLTADEDKLSAEDAAQEQDDWTYILVRGVANDWDLLHFDAQYETARFPSEWLWGPGSARDAIAWLRQNQPADDEVEILDRPFLIRFHDDLLYLPQSPGVAAGIPDDDRPRDLVPRPCGLAAGCVTTSARHWREDSGVPLRNDARSARSKSSAQVPGTKPWTAWPARA